MILSCLRSDIDLPKISNMNSPSTGKPVANQYKITMYVDGTLVEIFQSYRTIIAVLVYGKKPQVYLDKDSWDYGMTTGKYRNDFLKSDIKDTTRRVRSGEFKLEKLN